MHMTKDIPSLPDFVSGDTAPTVRSKLNQFADETEQQMQGVEDRLESSLAEAPGNGVLSGCLVSAGAGLSVNLSGGQAIIGFLIEVSPASNVGGLADNALNYVWLKQDGSLAFATSSSPPSDQAAILLATATTSGGAVTAVNNRPLGRQEVHSATATFACDSGVSVGNAVHQKPDADRTVAKAQANSSSTMPAVGVVIAKPDALTAQVALAGKVADVLQGLTRGARYWVSPSQAGAITATQPTSPDRPQLIGVALSDRELLVAGGALDESGSGTGAPTGASYVTINAEEGLSNETRHAEVPLAQRHPPANHTHDGSADSGAKLDHGAALSGLTDDDHTLYLRADGSRQLTGNLSVAAGGTIDGVDLSTHATAGTGVHGAVGGKFIALTPASDQQLFSGAGSAGAALANKGASAYAAREDHEHSSGGGVPAHRASHETGGSDLVRFADLQHSQADATTHDNYFSAPHISQADKDLISAHAARHQNGGADEISVEGLSGRLADKQDADKLQARAVDSAAPSDGNVLTWDNANSKWKPAAPTGGGGTPASTVTSERKLGTSSAVGTATNYAREDHTHGSPPISTIMRGSNLLLNSGFEEDTDADGIPDHWTFGGTGAHVRESAGTPPEGKYDVKLTRAAAGQSAYVQLETMVPVNTNEVYELRLWLKGDAAATCVVRHLDYDANGGYIGGGGVYFYSGIPAASWTRLSYRLTSEAASPSATRFTTGTRFVRIYVGCTDVANGDIWVDDLWFGPVRQWSGHDHWATSQTQQTVTEPCIRTDDRVVLTPLDSATSGGVATKTLTNLTSFIACRASDNPGSQGFDYLVIRP